MLTFPTGSAVNMTRDEIKEGLSDGSILLVDVREPHEYEAAHIPGAISLPMSSFDPRSLPIDGRRVVFTCAAGVRSLHAVHAAQEAGLPVEDHYLGGLEDWMLAGEPVDGDG